MIFLPYKPDLTLYRLPIVTVLVCLVCLLTFLSQLKSSTDYSRNISNYCSGSIDPNMRAILKGIEGGSCAKVYLAIRRAENRDEVIAEMAAGVRDLAFYTDKKADIDYKVAKITRGFADFEQSVPDQLTTKLQYEPGHANFMRMLTSTFAHADWGHLLGNLFFFFIFAACVECALGHVYFVLSFVLMAVVSSFAYSLDVDPAHALPTIGLSGIAMGQMALLTALLPRVRIWCFFWFLFWIRRFTLPAYVIALWYIGWDIWDLTHDDGSTNINYMAHVSGAMTGLVLGALFHLVHRERLQTLALEASA